LTSKRRKKSTSHGNDADFDEIFKDMGFGGFRDIFDGIFKGKNIDPDKLARLRLENIQDRLGQLDKKIDGIKGRSSPPEQQQQPKTIVKTMPPLAAAESPTELLEARRMQSSQGGENKGNGDGGG
jgi:hypothetical protein